LTCETLSWPAWARGAVPLFSALFDRCFGNYRVHMAAEGEEKIEVTMVVTKKNIGWLTEVAKRLNGP
jgi:hypothetical protein